jgi:hypothetical protein
MAWNSKRYYTRSIKRDGRVIRQYLGNKPAALVIAELDRKRRFERQQSAQQLRLLKAEMAELESLLQPLHDFADGAAALARIDAGYHNHKGQWRKKRVRPNYATPDESGIEGTSSPSGRQ